MEAGKTHVHSASLCFTILFVAARISAIAQVAREYCQAETFRAACSPEEVVMITEAKYGRMRIGRCVIKDYGSVGCHADVVRQLDGPCSGREECELRMPDAALDAVSPCPRDFRAYLLAGYTCLPVYTPLPCTHHCRNATEVAVLTREGYLSSTVSERTQCGRGQCPYLLRAQPGQRLNVTLLDFAMTSSRRSTSLSSLGFPDVCYKYAELHERYPVEGGGWKEHVEPVCRGKTRHAHVYTSQGDSLLITMMVGGRRGDSTAKFLLKYQVLGCADYVTPHHAVTRRAGDITRVSCLATDAAWTVTCDAGAWRGEVGACPPVSPETSASTSGGLLSVPMGILVAVILAISLVIGVFVLTAGLVVIKRRREASSSRRSADHQEYLKGHYGVTVHAKDCGQGGTTVARYQFPRPPEHTRRAVQMRPLPAIPQNEAGYDVTDEGNPHPQGYPHLEGFSQGYFSPPPGYEPSNKSEGSSRQYFVLDPDLEVAEAMESGVITAGDERYVSQTSYKSPEVTGHSSATAGYPVAFYPPHLTAYNETGNSNCSWP